MNCRSGFSFEKAYPDKTIADHCGLWIVLPSGNDQDSFVRNQVYRAPTYSYQFTRSMAEKPHGIVS